MSAQTTQQDSEVEKELAERKEQLGDDVGEEILSAYQDDKLGAVNDLVDESKIKNSSKVISKKYVIKSISFEESEMVQEVPANEADPDIIKRQYADVWATDRDEFVPADFEEGIMDFARPDTERVGTCSDCGGQGRNRCRKCSGSGQNSCRRCSGTGTNSDNTARCSSCGGSGTKVCKKCDGAGNIACSTCETTGQTWKVDFVRREFTPEEEINVTAPEVPDKFINQAEGEYVTTEEKTPKENEIRREIEERDVESEKVEYVYDSKDYELHRIEDNLKTESYPKNKARKLAPYVGAAIAVAIIGLWYFGII